MKDDGTVDWDEVEALAASKQNPVLLPSGSGHVGDPRRQMETDGPCEVSFATALALALSLAALAEPIIGQASVIDGDTLDIHGQRIRLSGIDAPESDQLYRGDNGPKQLTGFIAGRSVSCEGVGRDQYGRTVAVCSIGSATWKRGRAFGNR